MVEDDPVGSDERGHGVEDVGQSLNIESEAMENPIARQDVDRIKDRG